MDPERTPPPSDETRARYIPRPGYWIGTRRSGGRETWTCGHRHETKQQALDCAKR